MSRHNATFWVGANAVIRTRALRDIEEVETVGGFEVKRYVQDRTVIEDTESSVDLGMHGWTLVNYPERLSYSATPPDFGSLIVQRRRWANGGLLILPKYLRQVRERRQRGERVGLVEMSLRVNYMASIAWGSLGLIFLLAYPYDSRLLSPMVLLAALPYFWLFASDLEYCGYKRTDILRIYGFNLILMPVNVAGVLKSVQQALTAKKIPFARTPKVRDRTASPALYVLAPYAMVVFSVFTFVRDYQAQNWGNAVFAAFNALLAFYAIVAYIGIWNSVVDVWLWATKWMYYDPSARAARRAGRRQAKQDRKAARKGLLPEAEPVAEDWRAVLYFGHGGAELPPATVPGRSVPRQRAPSPSPPRGCPRPLLLRDHCRSRLHCLLRRTDRCLMSSTRRLSPLRVGLAVVLTAAVAAGGYLGFDRWQSAQAADAQQSWFAAYTDVTATPTFAFEDVKSAKGRDVMLSFVVADHDAACTPTWGAAYSLQGASDSLDLDRRIARLQQQKGEVGVSFGGLANDELATTCTTRPTSSVRTRPW